MNKERRERTAKALYDSLEAHVISGKDMRAPWLQQQWLEAADAADAVLSASWPYVATFRTEGSVGDKWETIVAGFATADEARLAFADAARYPLGRRYRIVNEVTEEVVFE